MEKSEEERNPLMLWFALPIGGDNKIEKGGKLDGTSLLAACQWRAGLQEALLCFNFRTADRRAELQLVDWIGGERNSC
ncbi:unnamed protein product [Urochloa humidicola]